MRIIGISGSPRGEQSSSRQLVEHVLEGAQAAGAQAELVDLSKLNVAYCTGCGVCHINGKCSQKDEFGAVQAKMLAADGIVLGSPVYFSTITAQLKTAIDRLSNAIHCQLFLGTYACSVATSGAPEQDLAIEYMNGVLMRLGCTVVGSAGAAMAIPGSIETAAQDAVVLGQDLVRAINEKRTYADQEAIHTTMRERFKYLITANKDHWPHEYNYIKSQNWL